MRKKYAKKYLKKKKLFRSRKRKVSTVSPKIKKYVNKVVHANIENKCYELHLINQNCNRPTNASAPQMINLLPYLAQGIQQGQRLGNEIRIRSSTLRVQFNRKPYDAVTNTMQSPVQCRLLVLKYKKANGATPVAADFLRIWQTGDNATSFQGSILDTMFRVNAELFTVCMDKIFNLDSSYYVNYDKSNVNGMKFMQRYIFNLTKFYKKLMKYDDTSTTPTNDSLFMCILPVSANGESGDGDLTPIEMHYALEVKYEDA